MIKRISMVLGVAAMVTVGGQTLSIGELSQSQALAATSAKSAKVTGHSIGASSYPVVAEDYHSKQVARPLISWRLGTVFWRWGRKFIVRRILSSPFDWAVKWYLERRGWYCPMIGPWWFCAQRVS